jgi:hypothetical protein
VRSLWKLKTPLMCMKLSNKVLGTLGTRDGNEEHGTSVKATWNDEGHTDCWGLVLNCYELRTRQHRNC